MPNNSQTTLKSIAAELGVSATTVSRVLSGQARRYRISKKTEEAVRKCAGEAKFSPNCVARGLRLKRTATIGVVIPDISNPFFAGIVRQAALAAQDSRYSVLVCDSRENEDREKESLALLRGRNVEGVILCPVGRSAAHVMTCEEAGLPIVLADRYFPGVRLPYVASDNVGGARAAANHLIENGHRRIACLLGLRDTSPTEDRLRGFREAMAAHKIPVDERLIAGDGFTEQNGYVTTKLLLKAAGDFTAIFAFSNQNSLGAVRALAEEGVKIPDDISIVSFDDQPYSAYLAAPMTAVAQSSAEMGAIAVRMLFDRIHSPDHAIQGGVLLPTSLVVRSSVRNLAQQKTLREQCHVCG